jgi:rubrerythrin
LRISINVYSDKELEMVNKVKGAIGAKQIHPQVLNFIVDLFYNSAVIESRISCGVCGSRLIDDACPICDGPRALKESYE